jgi:hypothetical protein
MVPHFRDETYGDVKTPGYNVRGRIVREFNVLGQNVREHIVSVPYKRAQFTGPIVDYFG